MRETHTPQSPATDALDRLETHIPGLDSLLGGGLGRGAIYLVMGRPGTGKTTFGNQLAFAHVQAGGRAVYLTLLAESHANMLKNLRGMSFVDDARINESLLYVGAYRALREEKLKGLLGLIRRIIRDEKATLLILDGISPARAYAENDAALKEFIVELQALGTMTECTTVLLANMTAEDANGPEHTMVDGLIELAFEQRHRSTSRTIEVLKLRGTVHMLGRHELLIDGRGINVYPRAEDLYDGSARVAPASDARVATGIAGLDEMLQGGFVAGSSNVLLGFTGSGKTTLGLQYLREGAERGEPGLYFGFYESPQRLILDAAKVGISLSDHEATGTVGLVWQPPYEHGLDALAERLFSDVEKRGVKRLVIDGLDGFRQAATVPGRTIRYLTAVSNELRRRGITTLITEETTKMNGPEVEIRVEGTSALADGILLLEYVTVGTELRRLVSIIKQRGSAHAHHLREFRLSETGLIVASDSLSAKQILESESQLLGTRRNRIAKPPTPGG